MKQKCKCGLALKGAETDAKNIWYCTKCDKTPKCPYCKRNTKEAGKAWYCEKCDVNVRAL